MNKNHGYIRARIKTQGQIARVYPYAVYWGKPLDDEHWCHGADEVILPYVGKILWVKKIRKGLFEFFYAIKGPDGLSVPPNWIAYFDSEHLVPPAEWSDTYNPSIVDDIWIDYEKDRFMMIDEILIVTG